MNPARVVVTHNCSLFRLGIQSDLHDCDDYRIVGEACIATEAVDLCIAQDPHVLIVDVNVEDDPFGALSTLKTRCPNLRYLVFATDFCSPQIRRAAAFGVHGFVARDAAPEQLRQAVAAVHSGHYFLDTIAAQGMIDVLKTVPEELFCSFDDRYNALTEREREVFALLAQGLTNKAIASSLRISRKTVEAHHNNILAKLNLHSPLELVRYAAQIGLINLS